MTDVSSVSSATLSELFMLKSQQEQIALEAQENIKLIKGELESRYAERAQDTLRQNGKDFGSVTVNEGPFKVKFNFRKRAEWEQPVLLNVLNGLDEDTARHYVDVKYTIPEAKYNAAPPDIKAALSRARTVHLQGISVDLEESDDA